MVKRKSTGRSVALKSPPRASGGAAKRRRTSASRATLNPSQPPSIYAVHPGVAMVQKWIHDLPVKTGRTLDQWLKHIRAAGPPTERECREWLKAAHQIGTNTAWWLAEKAFGNPLGLAEDTPEGYLAQAPVYVDAMYAGNKAALRPLHDELIALARGLGGDIRICPCKTIVPLYRRHVFAQIRPASSKRIELGFALGEEPFTARLRDTGGLIKKDRITHSVALTSLHDIDLQVKRWLKQAYERDAG